MYTLLFLTIYIPFGLVTFCCMYAIRRNERVYAYRQRLNTKVYYASIVDRFRDKDPAWRRKVYHSVSYHCMVTRFWRKLDDFYPDKTFVAIEGDFEAELQEKVKNLIEDALPKYLSKDNKINFDDTVKKIFGLLQIYMPVVSPNEDDE